VHTKTNVWDVPYCSQCIGHLKAVLSVGGIARLLVFLSLLFGLFLWYAVGMTTAVLTTILALLVTGFTYRILLARARALCSENCACVHKSVAYLGWHGAVHQFEFSSLSFARAFMVAICYAGRKPDPRSSTKFDHLRRLSSIARSKPGSAPLSMLISARP
jgi:hypothetical protein